MPTDPAISQLAHLIDLAIAPAFLLTGVGTFLNVLANRLARIIDRRRVLEVARGTIKGVEEEAVELGVLRERAVQISRAIRLCTFAAVLIASVIASLFLGAFVRIDVSLAIAVAFVLAMTSFIGGLVSFLHEVHLSFRRLRGS